MTVHRRFLKTALVFLTLFGSLIGAMMAVQLAGWMPARAFQAHLVAHASFQVYGFMLLFIQGISLAMLRTPRFPRALNPLTLALTTLGVLLSAFAELGVPVWAGRTALALGSLPLVWLSWPYGPYLVSGSLWLLAGILTGRYDLVLWGFATLFVLGLGQRMHPALLGQPALPRWARPTIAILWNLGLLLQQPALLLLAASLHCAGLRVFRAALRPGRLAWDLRSYLRLSYAWLLVACLMAVLQAPPSLTRHTLASGFLLTMMAGMALRIVPALERRAITAPGRPALILLGLQLGAILRLGAQAAGLSQVMALGGLVQLLAVTTFAIVLWQTMRPQPLTWINFLPRAGCYAGPTQRRELISS